MGRGLAQYHLAWGPAKAQALGGRAGEASVGQGSDGRAGPSERGTPLSESSPTNDQGAGSLRSLSDTGAETGRKRARKDGRLRWVPGEGAGGGETGPVRHRGPTTPPCPRRFQHQDPSSRKLEMLLGWKRPGSHSHDTNGGFYEPIRAVLST